MSRDRNERSGNAGGNRPASDRPASDVADRAAIAIQGTIRHQDDAYGYGMDSQGRPVNPGHPRYRG